jgi:uncharacterized membrane protein YqgA involved in biofilm formation
MIITGTLINTAAVIAGGSAGMALRKTLPSKYEEIYFKAVGLFTMLLGIKMAISIASPLPVVLSLVAGGFAGTALNLSGKAERLGNYVKRRANSSNDRFTEGLTTAFILFCVGSMTIVGCIEEGLGHSSSLLLTKSVMDFFSSLILGSVFGIGVACSAVPLLIFQGGITIVVSIIGKDIPGDIIAELSVTGGIILIGLSLELLRIKRMDVINLLPALLFIFLAIWAQHIMGTVAGMPGIFK